MVAHFVQNINPYHPRWMGESATLRRETGYQTSERKGRKASAPSQTESRVEQVAMDSESEDVYVRAVMENQPTLANVCHKQAQAGPKMGKVLGPYISRGVWYPPARRPGVKRHPKGLFINNFVLLQSNQGDAKRGLKT